ncbi:PAS domain S-box protein [Bosea sp. 2RAB26]|uniref:PAS domain S-box protein n=1 Tax=Bosea sp. 2RAB26 TaxID=3237476 RepID=UPI003F8FC193
MVRRSPDRHPSAAVWSKTTDAANDLARQVREQTTLFHFTDRLFRARTLVDIYEAALDAICSGLASPRASILRFDEGGTMRFVAWRGLSDGYRSAIDGHSPWQRQDREADPIFVSDVALSGEPQKLIETIIGEGIHALAFIPLAGADKLVGKFMVYYDTPRVFTDHERDLALIIARQLGFAIERHSNDASTRRLTALVESSEDAIIAKDLDGLITDWNPGAERLFGYRPEEVLGQSVLLLIPEDRRDEEPEILARIRAGERIEHFETIRRRKDGTPVAISLTISPIKDARGEIVGASKIARDISDQQRAQEQQQMLLREMNHRVKNVFALTSGIVNLSARSASSPAELAATVSERLATLSRAHALTMSAMAAGGEPAATTLHALIAAILAPYDVGERPRSEVSGADIPVPSALVTSLSLLLHEFATNAAKYGSLSTADGKVEITCSDRSSEFVLVWRERGGPSPTITRSDGFGSRLIKATASQLGRVSRDWDPLGVVIELVIQRDRLGT